MSTCCSDDLNLNILVKLFKMGEVELNFGLLTMKEYHQNCETASMCLCFFPSTIRYAMITVNGRAQQGTGTYYMRNRMEYQKYQGVWELKTCLLTKDREESWEDEDEQNEQDAAGDGAATHNH